MKKKILFVDDEEEDLQFWGKKLEEEGYEVIKSLTGKRALVILFENKEISLVILDILLPDIDGITILRKIKNDINPGLPVIMHTLYEYRDDFAVWASEAYVLKNRNDRFASELISAVKKFCPSE